MFSITREFHFCYGHRLIVVCALLAFLVGSGDAWSQSVHDAYEEFGAEYIREFQGESHKLPEYFRSVHEYMFRPDGLMKMTEQKRILTNTPYSENARRRLSKAIADELFLVKQMRAEKARELFPDDLRQKMQTRQFQLAESVMRRLDSLEDANDVFCANLLVTGGLSMDVIPDFLELTPEQRDRITDLQKNRQTEYFFLMSQADVEQIEKYNELQDLMAKIDGSMSDKEKDELSSKISLLEDELRGHLAPQVKKMAQEYRESFMQVLTDAQKAKINAVMADMPEYMKQLFAAIDKQGGGLSVLHNWQPGMGVPDGPNPNREAPRERKRGERTFPDGE